MTNPADGGAAFPMIGGRGGSVGMTLRDYFAAKAMASFMSSQEGMRTINMVANDRARHSDDVLAELAYGVADAMLKERAK